MKILLLHIFLLLATIGVHAQKLVQVNEMTPIPYGGEPPSDKSIQSAGQWAVIDIFAVGASNMECKSELILETTKITGGLRLYVYIPQSDKEILVVKEDFMPFHLKIPQGLLMAKKLYRVELSLQGDTEAFVDLGLPSRTLWARCNIGAKYPYEKGDYFAWGETHAKKKYDWSHYKYSNDSETKLTKYCTSLNSGKRIDNLTSLDATDDAAHTTIGMGDKYHMPTNEDFEELKEYCTWEWTSDFEGSGQPGYVVMHKRKRDIYIFLPSGGYKDGESVKREGYGYYWSSSLHEHYPNLARGLNFKSGGVIDVGDGNARCNGMLIRAVQSEPQNILGSLRR